MSDWIPVPEIENVLIVLARLAETPEEIAEVPVLPLLEALKDWQGGAVYVFHDPPEAGEVLEDADPDMAARFALAAQMSDVRAEVCRDALRRVFSRATVQRVVLIEAENGDVSVDEVDRYFASLNEFEMIWGGTWPYKFVLGMRTFHNEIFSDLDMAERDLRKAAELVADEKDLSFKVV